MLTKIQKPQHQLKICPLEDFDVLNSNFRGGNMKENNKGRI